MLVHVFDKMLYFAFFHHFISLFESFSFFLVQPKKKYHVKILQSIRAMANIICHCVLLPLGLLCYFGMASVS